MNENFNKFKKIVWRNIAIKCAVAAVAAALLAVNAVLLPCLLCSVHLLWVFYVLIALGGLISGGGIAFLCLRTNDKKIACKLDSELMLSERVQTAYEYRGTESDMLTLQLSDTVGKLASASAKMLPFGHTAATIALSAVLAANVIALPIITVYADNSPDSGITTPVDPPRQVTDWEWQALDDLIEYVRASQKADSYAKAGMLSALESLRTVLENGVSQSSLPVFVQNAITAIRNTVTEANERSDVTDEQKQNNSEEESYVINRLNEIFSLNLSGGDNEGGNDGDDEDNDDEPITPGNNSGTGELVVGGIPFFDPELGYVSSGDPALREKYYDVILKAMQEGTISREEWEYIVATYFADLKDPEE